LLSVVADTGVASCCLLLQEFANFGRGVIDFALLGVPAAIVNSGLKFMQKNLELSFQSRLTLYLHKLYTSNRAYYAASTLGGLTHADQRITEDVEKFCFSISDLYSHTFKVRGAQEFAGNQEQMCRICSCAGLQSALAVTPACTLRTLQQKVA
jgi:hypothetical protein